MHIGPSHGHIRKLAVFKIFDIGLNISALGIRWSYQSISFEKLPRFYVKDIFLAQKLRILEEIEKDNLKKPIKTALSKW